MTHRTGAVAVLASPLIVPQGADFTRSWLWAEGATPAQPGGWPGQWIGRMEIRTARGGDLIARFHTPDIATPDGTLTLASFNVGTPSSVAGIANGGTAGQITLTIPAAASTAWTWADRSGYPFDLELANTVTGRTVRFLEGAVVLSREVTTLG